MTTIHLARHGETVWHEGNRYAGATDVALTERGEHQALALAAWARAQQQSGAGLDLLVSSDLSRAMRTAEAVAEATGLQRRTEPRLREVDFGEAEGLTAAEMELRFPEERRAFETSPASSPLPGGESGEAAAERAVAALRELVLEDAAAGSARTVLVVAHTTLIRLTLCRLLGLPLDDYRRRFPKLDNVAVSTVRLHGDPDAGSAALLRFNVPTASGASAAS